MLGIVQAGGKGSRMDVLTRERAKPALPFAGTHQLVDIAMSTLANSGVQDVWVSVQYLAGSLDEHLQSGRPWDLDRNRGGYRRMVPEEGHGGAHHDGFAHGNADDLYRIRTDIDAAGHDLVVVVSADQVFQLDLRPVIAEHVSSKAQVTLMTTEVSWTDAKQKAVLTVDREGWVRKVDEKPDDPASRTISAEVMLFDRATLTRTLEQLRAQRHRGADDSTDTGLGDLAEHLLPELARRGVVRAHPLEGYWRDMGRPETYLAAHRDFVHGRLAFMADRDWPVRTGDLSLPAARVRPSAKVVDAAVSPGADVAGTVVRSVIGPGCVVEAGAVVEDSVLFADVVVRRDAQVRCAIVDEQVSIGRGAQVGGARKRRIHDDAIALVGRESVIAGGAVLEAGARLEPATRVGRR